MFWWGHQRCGEPTADVRLEWPLLRRVFRYFKPYWALGLIVLAAIGLGAALGLVPALVTKRLIDYLTASIAHPGGHFSVVALLIAALVGSSVLAGLIGVGESYFRNRISQNIMFDLRNQLFEKMLRQTVAFFTRTRTGDIMSRLQNDVNGVQGVVSDTLFSLVSTAVTLASTVVLLANLQVNVTGSLALFQRLFEYLDLHIEIADRPGARPLTDLLGEVSFDHVTFR